MGLQGLGFLSRLLGCWAILMVKPLATRLLIKNSANSKRSYRFNPKNLQGDKTDNENKQRRIQDIAQNPFFPLFSQIFPDCHPYFPDCHHQNIKRGRRLVHPQLPLRYAPDNILSINLNFTINVLFQMIISRSTSCQCTTS